MDTETKVAAPHITKARNVMPHVSTEPTGLMKPKLNSFAVS
jgi:hypothetical protein